MKEIELKPVNKFEKGKLSSNQAPHRTGTGAADLSAENISRVSSDKEEMACFGFVQRLSCRVGFIAWECATVFRVSWKHQNQGTSMTKIRYLTFHFILW